MSMTGNASRTSPASVLAAFVALAGLAVAAAGAIGGASGDPSADPAEQPSAAASTHQAAPQPSARKYRYKFSVEIAQGAAGGNGKPLAQIVSGGLVAWGEDTGRKHEFEEDYDWEGNVAIHWSREINAWPGQTLGLDVQPYFRGPEVPIRYFKCLIEVRRDSDGKWLIVKQNKETEKQTDCRLSAPAPPVYA